MKRKLICLRLLVGFLVLLMAAPPWIMAQSSRTSATFRQEELDQMLAPIALYPDSLLAQILVAATFPEEVVEADGWVRQNEDLRGDELNAALDRRDWDLSVKALVPFPKVLSMMSDKREWTQRLGDAFLAQQTDVMDTIQSLRAKAHAHGNLNSTNEQNVVVRGDSIEIVPTNPRVVYVPAYNPMVIYGPWWYSSYPPYAYSPYYPGYAYDPYYTGAGFITAGLFGFAAGIAVGSSWHHGWGRWDWGHQHHRNIHVNVTRNININRNDIGVRNVRTTSLNRVVNERRTGTTGRAELRTSDRQGRNAGPSSASVQKELKQRQGKAQVRQSKTTEQGSSQTKMRSDRSKSSGSSGNQISSGKSSERSHGQRGSSMSSQKSRGDNRRDGDPGRRGAKSRGGGGDAGNGGGRSNDKH